MLDTKLLLLEGLAGSGKSTTARRLEARLAEARVEVRGRVRGLIG